VIKAIATRRAFLRTFGFACTLSVLTLGTVESHAAVSIRIAMVSKGSSLAWPLYIADEKGFLTAYGKVADTVSALSSAGVQQSLASDSVKIGVGGLVDLERRAIGSWRR
jgi:ABC-type nitrate/sulfonate/bicarbonate transport system substrate-binding protein